MEIVTIPELSAETPSRQSAEDFAFTGRAAIGGEGSLHAMVQEADDTVVTWNDALDYLEGIGRPHGAGSCSGCGGCGGCGTGVRRT